MAVAQMRINPMDQDDFHDPIALALGLFCTWSLNYALFEAFISGVADVATISKVDIPPPPAEIMEIYTKSEKIEIPLDKVRALTHETCSYCSDMTAEFADVSVGVLEGRPDMNTIIVRTERGQRLVEEAEKEGYLVLADMPEEGLDHLMWAAANKKKKALLKAKQAGMLNRTEEKERSYLRVNEPVLEKIIA